MVSALIAAATENLIFCVTVLSRHTLTCARTETVGALNHIFAATCMFLIIY